PPCTAVYWDRIVVGWARSWAVEILAANREFASQAHLVTVLASKTSFLVIVSGVYGFLAHHCIRTGARSCIAQGPEMVYILCMPYADPTQQRHAQREWWKSEYQGSPTFRRKELRRKKAARAAWTSKRKAQNREYMREFMRAYRAKLKKKEKAK